MTQRGLRSSGPSGEDAVDIKNGFHHIRIHSLHLSTVQRSHLVTLITKAIDTTSISYQPLWLRCWRGDISSFFLQKNLTLLVRCTGYTVDNMGCLAIMLTVSVLLPFLCRDISSVELAVFCALSVSF